MRDIFEDIGEQFRKRMENRVVHHLHTNQESIQKIHSIYRKSALNISFAIDQYHCMNWILKDLPMHPIHPFPSFFLSIQTKKTVQDKNSTLCQVK